MDRDELRRNVEDGFDRWEHAVMSLTNGFSSRELEELKMLTNSIKESILECLDDYFQKECLDKSGNQRKDDADAQSG